MLVTFYHGTLVEQITLRTDTWMVRLKLHRRYNLLFVSLQCLLVVDL